VKAISTAMKQQLERGGQQLEKVGGMRYLKMAHIKA
jgi:hypothetical protein